ALMLLQFKFKAGLGVKAFAERLAAAVLAEEDKEAGYKSAAALVFLDGQMRVGDASCGSERRGSGKRKKRQLASWRRPAHCLPHCQTPVSLPSGTANPPEEVSLAPASPTDCSARLELVGDVAQPELRFAAHNAGTGTGVALRRLPLTWPANASGVANSCSTTEPSPCQLRQPPLRCLPLLSCRLVQQPARPPHRARFRPDVAGHHPGARWPAAAGRRAAPRRRSPDAAQPTICSTRRLTTTTILGRTAGGVVEILDGVHGGGGPAEDEEDDDATIVERRVNGPRHCSSCPRSAMVN
uniref:SUI1 domain-containing protein n=1 Tax=Macrostomum lignano TaxID=282301 RepID=A0A1I8FAV6_9PLAT